MKKYNSVFYIDGGSCVKEERWEQALNLPFRLHKGETVFEWYIVYSCRLTYPGVMVYEIISSSNYEYKPFGNPKDKGFTLVEERFFDCNLSATPSQTLKKKVTHTKSYLEI